MQAVTTELNRPPIIFDQMNTDFEQEEQQQQRSQPTNRGKRDEDPPKKKRKRRPPLVPWKKPKDMPRRPLSAYNIFFKEQRERLLRGESINDLDPPSADASTVTASNDKQKEMDVSNEEQGGEEAAGSTAKTPSGKSPSDGRSANKSVGIGFANLARTIATKWKTLPADKKAPFEERASKEKKRYNKEMLVWRAKQKEEKKKLGKQSQDQQDGQDTDEATIGNDSSGRGARAENATSHSCADIASTTCGKEDAMTATTEDAWQRQSSMASHEELAAKHWFDDVAFGRPGLPHNPENVPDYPQRSSLNNEHGQSSMHSSLQDNRQSAGICASDSWGMSSDRDRFNIGSPDERNAPFNDRISSTGRDSTMDAPRAGSSFSPYPDTWFEVQDPSPGMASRRSSGTMAYPSTLSLSSSLATNPVPTRSQSSGGFGDRMSWMILDNEGAVDDPHHVHCSSASGELSGKLPTRGNIPSDQHQSSFMGFGGDFNSKNSDQKNSRMMDNWYEHPEKESQDDHKPHANEESSFFPWETCQGRSDGGGDCWKFGIRSCEELAKDMNATTGPCSGNRMNDPLLGEASIKALGLRLGAENVNFLTALKFQSSPSNSSDSLSLSDHNRIVSS